MKIKFIFLALIFVSFSANANPWKEFKSGFKDLMEDLTEFGKEAERDFTISQLTKLHRDLLRIERSKEDLVFILKNPNIYYENLEETLLEAKESTESARNRLKNIRNRVALLSESASLIEQTLSDSLMARKSWLSQIQLSNPRIGGALFKDAKLAIKSLKYSRKNLEKYLRDEQKPNKLSQKDAASGASA